MRFRIAHIKFLTCWSQWPRGLNRRSAAFRLLRLWVRIPLVIWMSVSCECCVLSERGLCDELLTLLVESYRMWCVVVCDLETSWMRRPKPRWAVSPKKKYIFLQLRWRIRITPKYVCLLVDPCLVIHSVDVKWQLREAVSFRPVQIIFLFC
jgi:hypothetical protein